MNKLCFLLLLSSSVLVAKTISDTIILGSDTIETDKTFYKSGKPKSQVRYKNGKTDGDQVALYESGKRRYLHRYSDGCPLDTMQSFFENGRLESLEIFSGCKENGASLVWDSTGFLYQIWHLRNGKQVGHQEEWYGPNRPSHFSEYNNLGKQHGYEINWNEKGIMTDSLLWANDEMVSGKHYYATGRLKQDVYKEKDMFPTDGVMYDPSGKVCGRMVNGTGSITMYSDDAKRVWHETYKDGRLQSTDFGKLHEQWVKQGLVKEEE